jgi:hypothetical protein
MARLFTLDEANALLPQLNELLPALQTIAARLQHVQQEREALRERIRLNGNAHHAEEMAREQSQLESQLRAGLARVQQTGCELKDLSTGLVDFRSRRDGRVVYLCWRLGEDSIRYWHDLNSGFSGRQPL